ncbi:MAG TPA: hypothetical protein DDZ88_10125 [Verrucomicrobiales bacterium]|nr:hypothetical protein [Verrucomicrobiales bacterium]
MEWLDDFFANPRTPWIIGGTFVVITFLVATLWLAKGLKLQRAILQIRKCLALEARLSASSTVECWNGFAEAHYEAQEALCPFAQCQPLARQVLDYLGRCQPVRDAASQQWRLETPLAPHERLDLSRHLLELNVHVSFYRAWPNYLVGLGLCVTFLGLAVVIGNAGDVLATAKMESSNDALRDLLVAASSKFWSSLIAVLCSIGYGVFFRWTSQEMNRAVSLLAADLSRCVKVVTAGELQYESVTRLRASEQHQAVMATGIGLLKAGLENNQTNSAEQHRVLLEKLQAVADSLINKFGTLGADIGSGIASGLGKEITGEMREAANHMRGISEEFKHLTGKVKEQSSAIAANFSQSSDSAKAVAECFGQIPGTVEPVKQAALILHHAAEVIATNIGKTVQENENLTERWKELADLVQSLDAELGKAVGSVAEVFPNYADKLNDFSERWETAMDKALSGLKSSIEDLERSHENLRENGKTWEQMAGQVTVGIEVLSHQVGKLTSAFTVPAQTSETGSQPAGLPVDISISTVPLALAASSNDANSEMPLASRA